jgi:hypothetical protein
VTNFLVQLASAVSQAQANTATNSTAEPIPWQVHLAGDLAWPIAALAIALVFWRPLSALIGSGRITKFSFFNVGIELTPATSATDTPLLNDVRDADPAYISDSSAMLRDQVQLNTPAHFAMIDIGVGKEWLTTRLYVAAIMLSRMRSVKVFVFVETVGSTRRRFIAVAPLAELRWSLARKYSWLEAAWNRALQKVFPPGDPKTISADAQSMIQSDDGAFRPYDARRVTSEFIKQVQRSAPAPGNKGGARKAPKLTSDWVQFDDGRAERASWVTHELLEALMPGGTFQAWAWAMRDAPRARRNRAVLRRSGDFTALLDDERSFLRLVNRRAVLEELAATAGEEPEERSKAAS